MLGWLVIPLIGALIGYVTNVAAVRLLFRPHHPVRIPGTGIVLQGVLPRHRQEIAATVGRVVEQELLNADHILERLSREGVQERVLAVVAAAVEQELALRLGRFLPPAVAGAVSVLLRRVARRQAASFYVLTADRLVEVLRSDLDVAAMVRERLEGLDMEDIERLVLQVGRRELRHIEWLGGVLGFLIGLVQAGIVFLLRS